MGADYNIIGAFDWPMNLCLFVNFMFAKLRAIRSASPRCVHKLQSIYFPVELLKCKTTAARLSTAENVAKMTKHIREIEQIIIYMHVNT